MQILASVHPGKTAGTWPCTETVRMMGVSILKVFQIKWKQMHALMYSKTRLSEKCLFFPPEGLFQVRNEMGWESLDATEEGTVACWTLKQIGCLVRFTLGLGRRFNPHRMSLVVNCPIVYFKLIILYSLPVDDFSATVIQKAQQHHLLAVIPWSSIRPISESAAHSVEEKWESCSRIHQLWLDSGPLPSAQWKRIMGSFLHYLLDCE